MNSESEMQLIAFASVEKWEQWLAANHKLSDGIWIKFAKKASGIPSITYAEALEVALCHGWIDGQLKSIDAVFFRQRFTPRRPRSLWSKRNIEKVAALIAAGRMKPAGQEQIDAAKSDGRWAAAYDSPSTMQVPSDFQTALDANPKARAFFASLKRSNVYAFLYRLQTLKRPETRAARIKEYIRLLKAGKVLHLFAPKKEPAVKPQKKRA
ncbi:MAG: YdeI/OmpD-associated family protein [Nibricoccus sp.]